LLSLEHVAAPLGCLAVEGALRRIGRWNGQLIEVQRGKLRADEIRIITYIAETGTSRHRELHAIVEARVEEGPFAVHFEIGNEGIPMRYRAPASPGMEIDPGEPKRRREEPRFCLSVGSQPHSAEPHLRVDCSWAPPCH